jgi:H+/Cl- antiporter ClcA
LTITGMAAGFTVLFGAPLGGAVFALELLHRRGLEYYEALIPAVIGSLCGYSVFVCTTGLGLASVWHFPLTAPLQPMDLAWAVGAGIVAAGVATAFSWTSLRARRVFDRIPRFWRPVVGGAVRGGLAIWSPWALTFGEEQIDSLTAMQMTIPALAAAGAAKFLATSVTLSCGLRGGFIIPLFFIGAALGQLGHQGLPGGNQVVLMTALMAAINTGVTKTPLGSTLVVTKMAGLQLLPTTLLASIVTLLLTNQVGLIHSQRARGGEDSATERPAEPKPQKVHG